MTRLGDILARARGDDSVAAFARRLGYSYTFVRAIQKGSRLPSDRVLEDIAGTLALEPGTLVIAAYADRSPILAQALGRLGVDADVLASNAQAGPAVAVSTSLRDEVPEPRPDPTVGFAAAETDRTASA